MATGEPTLTEHGVFTVSGAELKAAVDALEAQIEQLSVNVSLANVVAPFDGKVGMRNAKAREYTYKPIIL